MGEKNSSDSLSFKEFKKMQKEKEKDGKLSDCVISFTDDMTDALEGIVDNVGEKNLGQID